MTLRRGATVAAAATALLAGCTGAGKREAAALVAAMDQYGRADNTAKGTQARLVETVVCTDDHVCSVKRACLEAVRPTARALALKDDVALRLGDIEQKRLAPDAPEARSLPDKLDEAGRLLGEGRTKMGECERMLTELRMQYSL